MIANVIPPRKTTTRRVSKPVSFQSRIAYICRKADVVVTRNLAGLWHHAARQMDAAASLAPRCSRPAYHLVLSWSALERPVASDMIAAARQMLHHIGAQEHQAVIALHGDRPHPHLHIQLNRIHSLTGKRLALRHDYARLELGCRRIERQFGWPADRGRYDAVMQDDDLQLKPKPISHWEHKKILRAQGIRPDPVTVRGPEYRTGWPALRDAIAPDILPRLRQILDQASKWSTVHTALGRIALRYDPCSTGARISHARLKWAMPASHLGSDFSRKRMEQRLGPYLRAGPEGATATAHLPLANFMPILEPKLRALTHDLKSRQRHRATRATLKRMLSHEMASIRTRLGRSHNPFAQALRRVAHEVHSQTLQHWDRTHPMPTRPEQASAYINERMQNRSRYRSHFRGHSLKDTTGLYPDFTALRQTWDLAAELESTPVAEPLSAIIAKNKDYLRYDGTDQLIISLRTGEDRMTGIATLSLTSGISDYYGAGMAILGSTSAKVVLVTGDMRMVIEALADPERLVVLLRTSSLDADIFDRVKEKIAGRRITLGIDLASTVLGRKLELYQTAPTQPARRLPDPCGD